jgi:hypothetical protein
MWSRPILFRRYDAHRCLDLFIADGEFVSTFTEDVNAK